MYKNSGEELRVLKKKNKGKVDYNIHYFVSILKSK